MVRIDITAVNEGGVGHDAQQHLLHQPAVPGKKLPPPAFVQEGVRVFYGLVRAEGILEVVEKVVLLGDELIAEESGVYKVDFHREILRISVLGFEFWVKESAFWIRRAECNT